jgi:hypothetical protein
LARIPQLSDDDLLLNTGVSFPITFARADIYCEEAKLAIPHWGRLSGYVVSTNERNNGYFPATGKLFLGDDAAQAIQQMRSPHGFGWRSAAHTTAAGRSTSAVPKKKPLRKGTRRIF